MAISILGGFLDGYNEDKKLEKSVNANALALGQKGVLDRRAAEAKQEYEAGEFDRREKVKADLKPTKSFNVDFNDGTSMSFPTRENFGNDTKLSVGLIDNALSQLDTQEKIDVFALAAESKGGYGSSVIPYIKGYRLNASQKWGPDNTGEPIGVNVNVGGNLYGEKQDQKHPNGDFFNQVKTKIAGYNENDIKDTGVKMLRVIPTTDGVYNIERLNENITGDITPDNTFLYTNSQLLHPNSPNKSVEDVNGVHILDNKIGVLTPELLTASINDMFTRNTANPNDLSAIYRDWDNFFFTPAVQDDPQTIENEGQGLELEVFVMGEDGKGRYEKRYIDTGWNQKDWSKNVYAAMNVNTFRGGRFNIIDDEEYNTDKTNIFNDLTAIAEAQDGAENSIFLALDIFNSVSVDGVDPASLAGNTVKFFNDVFVQKNSQVAQFFRGFDALISGTLDETWNGLDKSRKDEIRAANQGISNYINMGAEERDKFFSDTAEAVTLLEQIFTLLAYNVALTTQGGTSLSARVSNEDYDNSKAAVVGGGFDSQENRMLGLMQYYQGTISKSMSFHMLNNEQGYNIQPKRGKLRNGIIPLILKRESFDSGFEQAGSYKSPYSAINYLITRPNGEEKSRTWARAVKRAYVNKTNRLYDGDFDPNATVNALTP